jgi:hypothetical protein
MADKKISALTAASTPLVGTEVLPIVQSGATVKVANNDLRPKQIQSNATSGVLQVAGPGAAATRVMTTPDANFTVARTDAAQTFTDVQTFTEGNTNLYIENGFQTFSGTDYYYAQLRLKDTNNRTTILTSPNPLSINGQVGTSSGHAFDLLSNNAIRMSLHETNGNVTVSTGNLVIGTSGKGIDFSATPGTGTSELLADYEEGTFTPSYTGSTTNPTVAYSTQEGIYTKVGRLVTFKIILTTSSSSGGSGDLGVTGLPFAVSSGAGGSMQFSFAFAGAVLQAIPSGSNVVLYDTYAGTTNSKPTVIALTGAGGSTFLQFVGQYFV